MRITTHNTALIIIDMQEKLMSVMKDADLLESKTGICIKGISVFEEIPILVTEQYKKGLGSTVSSVQALTNGYPYFEKSSFSCMDDPIIRQHIGTLNKKNIILLGIESHVCVSQTALDLLAEGLTPVIVYDCTSSRNSVDKEMALLRLRAHGCIITTFESLLFELCRSSGTDTFKTISKLIK